MNRLVLLLTTCAIQVIAGSYLQGTDWRFIPDGDGNVHFVDLTENIQTQTRLEDNEVNFYYYSRKTIEPIKINLENIEVLKHSDFDPSRCSIFIVHGWKNDYNSDINVILRNAVLQKVDCNVFSVDWSGPAHNLYLTARSAVTPVGLILSKFILNLMPESIDLIQLMGHSLGAHICGVCGAHLNGQIRSIVGMDPALPLFSIEEIEDRLDPSDAVYVQVIHTCSGFLGFDDPIGHADFYPNGGSNQNGCGADIFGACAHSRSYIYYGESILTGYFVGTKCSNYLDYMTGKCEDNPEALMGTLDLDTTARGNYYLNTADQPPFALG